MDEEIRFAFCGNAMYTSLPNPPPQAALQGIVRAHLQERVALDDDLMELLVDTIRDDKRLQGGRSEQEHVSEDLELKLVDLEVSTDESVCGELVRHILDDVWAVVIPGRTPTVSVRSADVVEVAVERWSRGNFDSRRQSKCGCKATVLQTDILDNSALLNFPSDDEPIWFPVTAVDTDYNIQKLREANRASKTLDKAREDEMVDLLDAQATYTRGPSVILSPPFWFIRRIPIRGTNSSDE